MDFPVRQVGETNLHFYESNVDSDIQFVFVPGGLNPEVWKNQIRYFSKNYKVISFKPTISYRDYKGEKESLKNILDRDDLENVVLVSNLFGGSLVQEFEEEDCVTATILAGARKQFTRSVPRPLFNLGLKISCLEPKIVKKYFFSDFTKYKVVKSFVKDLESPDYTDFNSFLRNYRFNNPSEKCLVIHSEDCFLSDLDYLKSLNCSISVLNSCGLFSFYEKPQEFNKALLDFIQTENEEDDSRTLEEIKKSNRSLRDFEDNTSNSDRRKREEKAQKLLKIKTSRSK